MEQSVSNIAIKVLTPQVASQIAAGEVVDRPSSVVKELIENSLDAGSSHVVIEVSGGGMEMIRLVDDGYGIPSRYVETAFLRHATSKLTNSEDLGRIETLGFRGEALPSIASVSNLELTTRYSHEDVGLFIRLENGSVKKRQVLSRPPGTTVQVTHLFQNVPARLKFVKSVKTENGRISNLVNRYAISDPGVKFALTIDGRHIFSSPGTGDLRETLSSVLDPNTASSMLEIYGEESDTGVVKGYAAPPTISRSQRGYITIILNGRLIQDRRLSFAVEEAYQNLLMVGRRPVAVLIINIPPHDVDVNVHPGKTEVRLLKEREIFSLVQRSVRQALIGSAPVRLAGIRSSTLGKSPSLQTSLRLLGSVRAGWSSGPRIASNQSLLSATLTPTESLPLMRVLGQFNNTYIVTEGPEGLYFIDQHAAHERVLFEKVLEAKKENLVEVQGLLEPATVELTYSQREGLENLAPLIREHGFDFETFGPTTYVIRAVPAVSASRRADEVFLDVLDSLLDFGTKGTGDDKLASSIACHSAIRSGDILEERAMQEVIRLLEQSGNPHTCPHGRPTLLCVSSSMLEREFGRS